MKPEERLERVLASARDAYARGDASVLQHYGGELLALADSLGNRQQSAVAHNFLGTAAIYLGNADGAQFHYDAALELYRSVGDTQGIVAVLIGKGVIYGDFLLDYAESQRVFEEALSIARDAGEDRLIAFAHANLGEIRRLSGDYAGALTYAQASLELFEKLDDQAAAASQLINIAHYRSLRAEFATAIRALREADRKLRRDRRMPEVANYIEVWFFVAYGLGRYEEAAKLLGFLEFYRAEHRIPRLPSMLLWFSPRLERLEQRLGYDRFARLRREGELLTLDEANAITESIENEQKKAAEVNPRL